VPVPVPALRRVQVLVLVLALRRVPARALVLRLALRRVLVQQRPQEQPSASSRVRRCSRARLRE
jgi:hypothetical protein